MDSFIVYYKLGESSAGFHRTGTLDIGLDEESHGLRQKRATCDLFDFLGAGDSLCAAHCIAHRKAGGYCKNGVCHCR